MAKAVYDFLNSDRAHHNFTVGINDDVTHLSIPVDETYRVNNGNTEWFTHSVKHLLSLIINDKFSKIHLKLLLDKIYEYNK